MHLPPPVRSTRERRDCRCVGSRHDAATGFARTHGNAPVADKIVGHRLSRRVSRNAILSGACLRRSEIRRRGQSALDLPVEDKVGCGSERGRCKDVRHESMQRRHAGCPTRAARSVPSVVRAFGVAATFRKLRVRMQRLQLNRNVIGMRRRGVSLKSRRKRERHDENRRENRPPVDAGAKQLHGVTIGSSLATVQPKSLACSPKRM
jgi:hypothetical protein